MTNEVMILMLFTPKLFIMMKNIFIILLITFFNISVVTAQFSASVGYDLNLPTNQMALNIGAIHNFKVEGFIKMPENRWSFGMDLSVGGYGSKRDPIAFTQGNTVTNTFVSVSNMVYGFKGLAQADLFSRDDRALMPYFHSGFGMTFFETSLTVEDPQDIDNCRPLQSESLKSDQTWIASVGLGLRWHPKSLEGFYLDLRATQNLGGKLNYMSLNPPTTSHLNHNNSAAGTPVNVDFYNQQTNIIHQHRIGTVYNSAVSFWGVQLQFAYQF